MRNVESFDGKFRDECLNTGGKSYNQAPPHSSLGYPTPNEFRIERPRWRRFPHDASPSFGYAVQPAGTLVMTGTKQGQVSSATRISARKQLFRLRHPRQEQEDASTCFHSVSIATNANRAPSSKNNGIASPKAQSRATLAFRRDERLK
jgi:hypothetical protein